MKINDRCTFSGKDLMRVIRPKPNYTQIIYGRSIVDPVFR